MEFLVPIVPFVAVVLLAAWAGHATWRALNARPAHTATAGHDREQA